MIEIAIFEEHRPHKNGTDWPNARHPLQFLESEIHILQWQDRGGE